MSAITWADLLQFARRMDLSRLTDAELERAAQWSPTPYDDVGDVTDDERLALGHLAALNGGAA